MIVKSVYFIITIFAGAALCLLTARPVHAQLDPACQANPNSALCQDVNGTRAKSNFGLYGPDGLLTNITNLISIITGIAGVIMLMLGAFRYIRSSGDPSNISNAQNTILFALIGLVIAASARALVLFVLSRV